MKENTFAKLYFTIPLVLFLLQAVYTFNSFGQIRIEELLESVRSVWWFQNRLVFNGAFSNFGWYAPLALIYNVFGFSLSAAKYLRLVIALVSLFCLASVLKKYFGVKRSWLPLLTIGLSPTLLYFNVLQVQYGIDLQFFPICLWFATGLTFNKNSQILGQILLWTLAMIAWMAYPAFIYYLPVLAFIHAYKLWNSSNYQSLRSSSSVARTAGLKLLKKLRYPKLLNYLAIAVISFLLPLILSVLYIQNRDLLWFDPYVQRGMFRNNGEVSLNLAQVVENVRVMSIDMFVAPVSWHFEVHKVEFSDYYPIITILGVLLFCLLLLRKKKYRFPLILLLLYFLLNILATNLTGEAGGVRRNTVLLAIFYVLFSFVWAHGMGVRTSKYARYTFIGVFGLLLFHHVISYPVNLKYLKEPSKFKEDVWFVQAETPQKSLDLFVNIITKTDLSLICKDQSGENSQCKHYTLIYPAIAGSCFWNKLFCNKLLIYEPNSGEMIPLDFGYWGKSNKGV